MRRATLAVLVSFFVVHFPGARFGALGGTVNTLRALVFIGAVGWLLGVFGRELVPAVRRELRQHPRAAVLATIVLGFSTMVTVPHRLVGLGKSYATMASAPFSETSPLFHRRLLAPVLGHPLVALAGPGGYWVGALAATALAVFAVVLAGERALSQRVPVAIRCVLYAAICSSGTFAFALYAPGYPDMLALAVVILASTLPSSPRARAAALALALCAHEAVAFASSAPLLVIASSRDRRAGVAVLVAYGAIGLAAGALSSGGSAAAHFEVSGRAPWQWMHDEPLRAAMGAAYGQKFLWLIVLVGAAVAWARGARRVALAMLAIGLVPVALIAIATDASRLAGVGVLATIYATAELVRRSRRSRDALALIAVASLASVLLPPAYHATNVPPVHPSRSIAAFMLGDLCTRDPGYVCPK